MKLFGITSSTGPEQGVALVEYIVLASLLALVAVASIQSFSKKNVDQFCIAASIMDENEQLVDCMAAPGLESGGPGQTDDGENLAGGWLITNPPPINSVSPEPTPKPCTPSPEYCEDGTLCPMAGLNCWRDCTLCSSSKETEEEVNCNDTTQHNVPRCDPRQTNHTEVFCTGNWSTSEERCIYDCSFCETYLNPGTGGNESYY